MIFVLCLGVLKSLRPSRLAYGTGKSQIKYSQIKHKIENKRSGHCFPAFKLSFYNFISHKLLADLQLAEPALALNLDHTVQIAILAHPSAHCLALLIHELHHHPDAAEGHKIDVCPSLLTIRSSSGDEKFADSGVLGAVEREVAVLLSARTVEYRDTYGDQWEHGDRGGHDDRGAHVGWGQYSDRGLHGGVVVYYGLRLPVVLSGC